MNLKLNRKQKGFSLIELLIVVAIILIIAAIAIPNLLRSKMAANGASAVGSIRTIITAEVTYSSTYGDGFSPDLVTLGGPATVTTASCNNALLVDSVLGGQANNTQKSGYSFFYAAAGPVPAASVPTACTAAGFNTFTVDANPIVQGTTGQASYCGDASGVIRFDGNGAVLADNGVQCAAGLQALGN